MASRTGDSKSNAGWATPDLIGCPSRSSGEFLEDPLVGLRRWRESPLIPSTNGFRWAGQWTRQWRGVGRCPTASPVHDWVMNERIASWSRCGGTGADLLVGGAGSDVLETLGRSAAERASPGINSIRHRVDPLTIWPCDPGSPPAQHCTPRVGSPITSALQP